MHKNYIKKKGGDPNIQRNTLSSFPDIPCGNIRYQTLDIYQSIYQSIDVWNCKTERLCFVSKSPYSVNSKQTLQQKQP